MPSLHGVDFYLWNFAVRLMLIDTGAFIQGFTVGNFAIKDFHTVHRCASQSSHTDLNLILRVLVGFTRMSGREQTRCETALIPSAVSK